VSEFITRITELIVKTVVVELTKKGIEKTVASSFPLRRIKRLFSKKR